MTTSEIEWQPVTTSATMSDNEGQWVVRRMTSSGTTSDIEWQRMTTSDNKWQWVIASDKNGTTNKNGTVYFKEWIIAIFSITKIVIPLQGVDGWY